LVNRVIHYIFTASPDLVESGSPKQRAKRTLPMTYQNMRSGRACLPFLAKLAGVILTLSTFGLALAKEPAAQQSAPPNVSAKAWAIADGKTGKVLWGFKETEPRAIASTTKIMTAFLVVQLAEKDPQVLDEEIVFSERAAAVPGSSSHLRAGERLPVRELLYGMLLPSGNDAAVAFAEHFGPRFKSGNQKENDPVKLFVAEMNRRAKELKLTQTSFLDPNGLARNQASARDLAALAWTVMQNKLFRQYVSTRRHSYKVATKDGQTREVAWANTNKLLGEEGFDGIKTGTTNAAGACLVASGTKGGDHLIVVVLGASPSDARYTDARALFQWAWDQRASGKAKD
jgi:D-alanyl-D-alanine carboxypeptidase (penicillin-binding protein 5/6)